MVDPDAVERIRSYLNEHRLTQSQDALKHQLLLDGHPSAAIDQAMLHVYGLVVEPIPSPLPATRTGPNTVLVAIGVCISNYLLLPLITWSIFVLVENFGGSEASILLGYAPALIFLAVEIGLVFYLRRSNRPLSRGLAWGIALSFLPVIAFGLLLAFVVAFANSNF